MLRKIVYSIFIFVGVALVVFLLFQAFGDPARLIAGQTGDQKTIDNIRKDLNLDQPKWKQFVIYLNDISPVGIHQENEIKKKNLKGFFFGKARKIGIKIPYLGNSFQSKKPVSEILFNAFPTTFVLAFSAMLFACIVGISLGVLAALKKDSWIDNASVVTSIVGISLPSFFIAIVVAYLFGIVLHHYTGLNLTGSLYEMDDLTGEKYLSLKNLILPALTLGIRPLSIITQLTRSAMLDVLGQDYVRTAHAMGLSKKIIYLKYALRNALNPIVTSITGWFAELLAGSFFIEFIFGWNGIGKITVDALSKLDYPVVIGAVLCSACIFIIINLLSDLVYRIIDPRIGKV